MIVLFTDFGYEGPYIGQMKGVLSNRALNIPIIDLMHDAPVFNPRAAARLLASLIAPFPEQTVFLCVVDPEVGHPERRPCIVKADNRWFVGPDNGLFNTVINEAGEVQAWEITWRPEALSSSFHGRDLFAPVAAQLAMGQMPEAERISPANMLPADWPSNLAEIIYIDHYGNAMTGIRADTINNNQTIEIKGRKLYYAQTFSAAEPGRAFWYRNSAGLVEIAMDRGSVAVQLGLQLGDPVTSG